MLEGLADPTALLPLQLPAEAPWQWLRLLKQLGPASCVGDQDGAPGPTLTTG